MPHIHCTCTCTCTVFSIDTELLFHVNECPCEALFTEDEDGKIKLCDDNGNIHHIHVHVHDVHIYTCTCTMYIVQCIVHL